MTLALAHLQASKPPWIVQLTTELSAESVAVNLSEELGITVRVLDAARMRTKSGLFDEFASRLDFPDYFGRNWDALDECLSDLGWLRGVAYAILIERASRLLEDEASDQLLIFLKTIEHAAADWATPVSRGESWDRMAIPFHVLLHESAALQQHARDEFRALGVELSDLKID
jgi:RNAse (barnase) inhibitor barstar